MLRIVIKFGLVSCGLLLAIHFISLLMGKPSPENYALMEVFGYVAIVLSLSVMFFGIRSYRDRELGGNITFGRAFMFGTYINILASLTFAFYNWIYVKFLFPDFMKNFMEYSKMQILNSGKSQTEINQMLATMESMVSRYSNIWFQSFVMFMTVFLIGLVIALISALILKKRSLMEQNV